MSVVQCGAVWCMDERPGPGFIVIKGTGPGGSWGQAQIGTPTVRVGRHLRAGADGPVPLKGPRETGLPGTKGHSQVECNGPAASWGRQPRLGPRSQRPAPYVHSLGPSIRSSLGRSVPEAPRGHSSPHERARRPPPPLRPAAPLSGDLAVGAAVTYIAPRPPTKSTNEVRRG